MANPLLALDVQAPDVATNFLKGQVAGQEMRTASLSNILESYKLKQAQDADKRSNALATLYQQHGAGIAQGNPDDINALASVDPNAAIEAKDKTQKLASDVFKDHIDKAEFIGRSASSILGAPPEARPLLYTRALQQAKDMGIDVSNAPPQYDENAVKQMAADAVSAKDQLTAHHEDAVLREQNRHNVAEENKPVEQALGSTLVSPKTGLPVAGGQAQTSVSPDLSTYPSDTQGMVKAMLEGRQAPPTSMALRTPYWQNLLTVANAVDPNFDQTTWGARAGMRKDMTGGGKNSQLLNSGNTAIQHLGRLFDQIPTTSGLRVPLVGNAINSAVNATEQASGVPGVNAYKDTLGHLSEETTKFYRTTGGNEQDIQRTMENLSPNLSTDQKMAGVGNTVHLIFGALQPKVEQYNLTMGTNFPVSHFLSKKSVEVIKKMGFDPDTGEKVATGANNNAAPAPGAGTVLKYDKDGNLIPEGK